MDWANDDAYLNYYGSRVRRIFKYGSRYSRIIKIVEGNGYQAQIWSMKSHESWQQWLDEHIKHEDRGLVLLLADRTAGGSEWENAAGPLSINEWLENLEADMKCSDVLRHETTFATLGEKMSSDDRQAATSRPPTKSRSILHLPFAQQTFGLICDRFQVHQSIVRTIARSDVPAFSSDLVHMRRPALVLNCRTPNTWEDDLALSATHYTQNGLTHAIIYGSSPEFERSLLKRLQCVTNEAAHPLLLPGIVAELELIRHTQLVEASINEVEARIFELNFQSNKARNMLRSEVEARNRLKRESWLDLSYLRNSISTWHTQVQKMVDSVGTHDVVDRKARKPRSTADTPLAPMQAPVGRIIDNRETQQDLATSVIIRDRSGPSSGNVCEDEEQHTLEMQQVGAKIKNRLHGILENYDEKIRDCTMRMDGMVMATQWSQSETAVEIALATNQDSKIMRSIALVTMVFLPGTFFATVFSMTFFNWFDDGGKTRVSSYVWIYVVVTTVFTAITLGLWYFFVLFRRPQASKNDEEKLRME